MTAPNPLESTYDLLVVPFTQEDRHFPCTPDETAYCYVWSVNNDGATLLMEQDMTGSSLELWNDIGAYVLQCVRDPNCYRIVSPHMKAVLQRALWWLAVKCGRGSDDWEVFHTSPFNTKGYTTNERVVDLVELFHGPAVLNVDERRWTIPATMCQTLGLTHKKETDIVNLFTKLR